jgi:hypothetical protein
LTRRPANTPGIWHGRRSFSGWRLRRVRWAPPRTTCSARARDGIPDPALEGLAASVRSTQVINGAATTAAEGVPGTQPGQRQRDPASLLHGILFRRPETERQKRAEGGRIAKPGGIDACPAPCMPAQTGYPFRRSTSPNRKAYDRGKVGSSWVYKP